jgi:hypothetical protein
MGLKKKLKKIIMPYGFSGVTEYEREKKAIKKVVKKKPWWK